MKRSFPLTGIFFALALVAQPFDTFLPLVLNGSLGGTIPQATATRTPTSTPTLITLPSPTPTWTSTPTPTTTPTADLSVLDNHSTYTDTLGSRYIVGEVQNNRSSNFRFVRVHADVFNAQGQLIDTDFTFAQRSIIEPNGKSCFKILLLDDPAGFDHYELTVQADTTTEQPRPLALLNINEGPNTFAFELIGQVRNDGQEDAEFVKIVGTLYDGDGTVIDCSFTYANLDTIAPGALSSWSLLFLGIERERIALYSLIAD